MTNRMKLVFVLTTAGFAVFAAALSSPVVIDTAGMVLSTLGRALGLHQAPISSVLAVLGIPFLYLVIMKTRHGWHKKGGA